MGPKKVEGSTQQATDALYILESLSHVVTPIVINAAEISQRTGAKVNTIIKRFGTLRQRYPGLNIQTTTVARSGDVGIASAADPPSTPIVQTNKRKASGPGKPRSVPPALKSGRKQNGKSGASDAESDGDETTALSQISALPEQDDAGDDSADNALITESLKNKTAGKRKRQSVTPGAAAVRKPKKAKTTSTPMVQDADSADELASEDYLADTDKTPHRARSIPVDKAVAKASKNQVDDVNDSDVQMGRGVNGFLVGSDEEGTVHYSNLASTTKSCPDSPAYDTTADFKMTTQPLHGAISHVTIPESKQTIPPSTPTPVAVEEVAPKLAYLKPTWSLVPPPRTKAPYQPAKSLLSDTTHASSIHGFPTDNAVSPQQFRTPSSVPAGPPANKLTFGGEPIRTEPLSTFTKSMIETGNGSFVGGWNDGVENVDRFGTEGVENVSKETHSSSRTPYQWFGPE